MVGRCRSVVVSGFSRTKALWRNLAHRERADRELGDELEIIYLQLVDEEVGKGKPRAEAERAARLVLGTKTSIADNVRDVRSGARLDGLYQDGRYAWRLLIRAPRFTVVAVAMLAFGIGINAMMFTVVNAVLFKGFPLVHENDRLLYMSSIEGGSVSYADFEEWRARATSFKGMVLVHGTQHVYSDGNDGVQERFTSTEVSSGTFRMLGQAPILGRDFNADDEVNGAAPVVILSHRFWERRYQKDPAVVGRVVRVNGAPTTVIGVMPRGFTFPENQDFWVPLVATPYVRRPGNYEGGWFVLGRLADGVDASAARAEMATLAKRPDRASKDKPIHVYNFREFFIGETAIVIYQAMWGAVAVVLLITCANLANLLIGRAMDRSREISVRLALGAARWRIVRQLLIESAMLSVLGGAAGWWIAALGVRLFTTAATGSGLSPNIGGDFFDNVLDYTLDYRVFAYLVAMSIGTGFIFGLIPAVRLSRVAINGALKGAGRSTDARGTRLSSALVVVEMALAVVLLAGAGVLLRSFLTIYNADLGFESGGISVAGIALPASRYPDKDAQWAFYQKLTARLAAAPGVEAATVTLSQPGMAAWMRRYERAGAPAIDPQKRPSVRGTTIGPRYFETLGARLVAGREFDERDGAPGRTAVIVTQRFAAETWPGESAIGKQLRLFEGPAAGEWLTVVGVAPSLAQKYTGFAQDVDPWVYLPYRQQPSLWMQVMARARAPLTTIALAFRSEVLALNRDLPISTPVPLSKQLSQRYVYRGITGALFLTCAIVALLLASIGLYAVAAHAVSRRTQEIGVRMAIGATASDILRLVFRHSLTSVVTGLVVGLAASAAVNRMLESQLVEVSPTDPATLGAACAVLVAGAAAGNLMPALRAIRVDPVVALRHD